MLELIKTQSRAPGECLIHIGDAEIVDLYPFLMEVTVDTAREAASEAVLKFETRRDLDGSWIVQDDDRIRPWKPLRIEAAFGDETEEVMRGYIRQIDVSFPEDTGGATVTLAVQDDSLALDRTARTEAWGAEGRTTDQAIVTDILSRNDLVPEGMPALGQTDLAVTQDDTDAAFLRKRAEVNGFELIYRRGAVYFGPRRLTAAPQATVKVYAGPDTTCLNFAVTDDGMKPDGVEYDVASAEGASTETRRLAPNLDALGPEPASSVAALDDGFVWKIRKEGESDAAKAETLAQEKANANAMKISGKGVLDGALYGHVLLTGLPVGVDGVGNRHSGIWYVDRVRHVFDTTGYRQEFELQRNAYGDNLPETGDPLARLRGVGT
ncbi:hypothetical protein PVW48_13390 [Dinoroseobacter sp. PD6]|uniref:phage late control D family protein n=1 Tax=Dinoroseobacter sp. PD6 TaxID=3028384 RepID=UPI00237AE37A|nr:hypothetical protein [Dinoroseobacter sp. PD6]MDD9717747.1 hypothetical protein [Dinoroseobacter sp. PD6]